MASYHRRGHSLSGGFPVNDSDENLDLFSENRLSNASSEVSVKLRRFSVGSPELSKTGLDDLLTSTDGGKNDYDWLLAPPETPICASLDGTGSKQTSLAPRSDSTVRPVSPAKTSRHSSTQSESNHSARPIRSSSVTRSVSSYTRPSSPITRSPSTARPSTPSARPALSRPSTPSKPRPLTNSAIDKTRPSQSSRPSTPSSRPQVPANSTYSVTRSSSRPSTPTRRNSAPSLSSPASPSTSVGCIVCNGRTAAPASRPSSPSPRVRPPPQPIVPPDFPLETPPNLRTTLPDRPLSAGRSRPGASVTTNAIHDTTGPLNAGRPSSPLVTRGRLAEPQGRGRISFNGHLSGIHEPCKTSLTSSSALQKPVKSSMTTSTINGFGRSISKNSPDMTVRHLDIRNGTWSTRLVSGSTRFPRSIRSSTAKGQALRTQNASDTIRIGQSVHNGYISENKSNMSRSIENESDVNSGRYPAKLSEVDIYDSSRYDAILLDEDLKNTNWLVDDRTDQGPIFDNGFEPPPEPFRQL